MEEPALGHNQFRLSVQMQGFMKILGFVDKGGLQAAHLLLGWD
jgi:hypothetical protein